MSMLVKFSRTRNESVVLESSSSSSSSSLTSPCVREHSNQYISEEEKRGTDCRLTTASQ